MVIPLAALQARVRMQTATRLSVLRMTKNLSVMTNTEMKFPANPIAVAVIIPTRTTMRQSRRQRLAIARQSHVVAVSWIHVDIRAAQMATLFGKPSIVPLTADPMSAMIQFVKDAEQIPTVVLLENTTVRRLRLDA